MLLMEHVHVQAASSTSGAESTVTNAHREALLEVLSLLRTARSVKAEILFSRFHLVAGVGRLGVLSDCRTSQRLDNSLRVISQARHSGRCDSTVFFVRLSNRRYHHGLHHLFVFSFQGFERVRIKSFTLPRLELRLLRWTTTVSSITEMATVKSALLPLSGIDID